MDGAHRFLILLSRSLYGARFSAVAKKIRIVDQDLRDPQRGDSLESQSRRSTEVLRALSIAVGLYAMLHKLLVPILLQLTPLRNAAAGKIDIWFVPILVWTYLLKRSSHAARLNPFLWGALIFHGAFELYRVFVASNLSGWPAWSHLLSSLPVAACAIAWLTASKRNFDFVAALVGALSVFGVVAVWPHEPLVPLQQVVTIAKPSPRILELNNHGPVPDCGAQQLQVKTPPKPSQAILKVESCGLSPTTLSLTTGTKLRVINRLSKAVNVHFYLRRNGSFVQGWNILVAKQSSLESPAINLGEDEVGVVFSDAHPKLGLTALFGPQGLSRSRAWYFSREPLKVESLDEF